MKAAAVFYAQRKTPKRNDLFRGLSFLGGSSDLFSSEVMFFYGVRGGFGHFGVATDVLVRLSR